MFCIKVEQTRVPRKEWVRSLFEKFFVPFIFNLWTQIVVFGIAICLIVIGIQSCAKMKLGLNQSVSLIEGSDLFDYFDTLFDYG